jgi:hypothetical protein
VSEIEVTQLDGEEFSVQVREGQATSHEVSVPRGLLEELGIADVDAETIVRETFSFLLEREPATSILPRFSLDQVPRFFPEYSEEIVRRVRA